MKTAAILGSILGGLFRFWGVLQEPPVFMRAAVVKEHSFGANTQLTSSSRIPVSGLRNSMDVGANEVVSAAGIH